MRFLGPVRGVLLVLVFAGVAAALPSPQFWGKKKKPVALPPPEPPPAYLPVLPLQPGLQAGWPVIQPARPDPVKLLSAKVAETYQRGVEAYQAGHLVKARAEFDAAVDLVLQSGVDLNAHPELQRDFERMLDSIYRFELVALKEGDGFTERKPIPAAIEEINDLNVDAKADPRLREKLQREVQEMRSDLPLVT